jgi:hypothetical protein
MVPENKHDRRCKLTSLTFKTIAIFHNTLLITFFKFLETVSKGLFRNRSQNRCYTFLDCHNVCKACAFHDALQAPDQGSTVGFFLFPRLKSIMKGAGFADEATIQERVTAVLRSIPKEAFVDSFQKLYERCQQCVLNDGDYLEGQ